MATKIEKLSKKINDSYRDHLAKQFKDKFGLEIETSFNFLAMTLYSNRKDGEDFTTEQFDWINAFEAGYLAAMNQVYE